MIQDVISHMIARNRLLLNDLYIYIENPIFLLIKII